MGVQENTLKLVEEIENILAKLSLKCENMTAVQTQNLNYIGYHQGRELALKVCALIINVYMEMVHNF